MKFFNFKRLFGSRKLMAVMDGDQKRELLAQAEENIAEARSYILRQRLTIARLSREGQAVTDEVKTLEAMQTSLHTLESVRKHLEIELEKNR